MPEGRNQLIERRVYPRSAYLLYWGFQLSKLHNSLVDFVVRLANELAIVSELAFHILDDLTELKR